MNETFATPAIERNLWKRGFLMLMMALAYHVAGTVLFLVALIQFVITLLNGKPNERLASFGRSLARYFEQVVNFVTFASEALPFPFNDWPASD